MSTITREISTLPTPPSRQRPATFSSEADAFLAALPDFTDDVNTVSTQMNTVAGEVNINATTASDSAATATAQAVIATTKASESLISANNADTSEANALSYANSALDSKNAAAASALETANKVTKVASTDNAIVRFNGTTGEVQNSGVIIDDSNNITASSSSNINLKLCKNGVDCADLGTDTIPYVNGGTGLSLRVNNTERMRIDNSGNVGIGTSSPVRQLQLHHTSLPIIQLTNSTTGANDANRGGLIYQSGTGMYITNKEDASLFIGTNGNVNMEISSSGNLLVGTTTDNGVDKLQVNGSIIANGQSLGREWVGVGSTTVTTAIRVNSTYNGGGLLIIRGYEGSTGASFSRLYLLNVQVPGGTGNTSMTLVSSAGNSTPSFSLGVSNGFVTINGSGTGGGNWYVTSIGSAL